METNASKVAEYYNRSHESYLKIYGDVVQAYRPVDTTQLLEYLVNSIGVENGIRMLDVGAGYCGPALFFCQHFNQLIIDAITVSEKQFKEANKRIEQLGLSERLHTKVGDFHFLNSYYEGQYDIIFFLESLGHASNPAIVIEQAVNLLKEGGKIYIKDFFRKKSKDLTYRGKINSMIDKINTAYSYNVLDLESLISNLREHNMEIEFIRKPLFEDNVSIPSLFERENKLDIHIGNNKELVYAEWLELRMFKRWG